MTVSPRRPALVIAVALLLLGASPAAGERGRGDQTTDKAKRHFERGQKLFALLRFADALVEYQAAFDARPIPDFLFNIGQCHRNLGNYRAAIFSFRRYLNLRPDADNRAQVEKLIAELEAEERKADGRKIEPPPPRTAAGKPVYKRWWFWTGVAAVAAAGTAAVVIGSSGSGVPGTDLGNLDFPR